MKSNFFDQEKQSSSPPEVSPDLPLLAQIANKADQKINQFMRSFITNDEAIKTLFDFMQISIRGMMHYAAESDVDPVEHVRGDLFALFDKLRYYSTSKKITLNFDDEFKAIVRQNGYTSTVNAYLKILLVLIDNAVKFADQNICIEGGIKTEKHGERRVVTRVIDDGPLPHAALSEIYKIQDTSIEEAFLTKGLDVPWNQGGSESQKIAMDLDGLIQFHVEEQSEKGSPKIHEDLKKADPHEKGSHLSQMKQLKYAEVYVPIEKFEQNDSLGQAVFNMTPKQKKCLFYYEVHNLRNLFPRLSDYVHTYPALQNLICDLKFILKQLHPKFKEEERQFASFEAKITPQSKIAVVDDDIFNQDLLIKKLQKITSKLNIPAENIVGFLSAKDAFNTILDKHRKQDGTYFSLVITDLNMSGWNGLKLAEQLNAQLKKEECPQIVLLTGDSVASIRKEPYIQAILEKPATSEILESILHKINFLIANDWSFPKTCTIRKDYKQRRNATASTACRTKNRLLFL